MSIRVTLPRPSVKSIDLSSTKLMRTIGQALVGRIRARTEKGIDAEGRPFRSLSASYAAAKSRAVGNSSPNLTVSGRMLNDMQAKPRPNGVAIGFISSGGRGSGTFIQRSRAVGAADKATWHNITGAGKSRVKREFFGLSEADEEFILDRVDAFIRRQL